MKPRCFTEAKGARNKKATKKVVNYAAGAPLMRFCLGRWSFDLPQTRIWVPHPFPSSGKEWEEECSSECSVLSKLKTEYSPFPISANAGYFRFSALAIFRDTLHYPFYE